MRIVSFQIIFILFSLSIFAQSPHGDKFDIDCSKCHVAESWKINLSKVTFDHSKTNFALVGQHQAVDCRSCHQSLTFSKINMDCFSCHKDIHQGTVGFDCVSCHNSTSWIVKDIIGLHQTSRFPLLGTHRLVDCAQCHADYPELKFEPLNVDCYECHAQNYLSAQSPNHTSANFSTDCQECHSVNSFSWSTTNINHSFFPLAGGHAIPNCFSCHQQGGNFSGLSPECYSCHRPDYESTNDPNHITSGFPTTCQVCHSINGWEPANFNHNLTQFPLTGKHVNVDCTTCHATGYTGTSTECYSCHQADYNGTTDPNHITEGFPTDCSLCHTTSGWNGATFDHNLSAFPLTGMHVTVNCASCHTSGYTGTSTECYSCHQADYNGTNDPNHITEGFPTDCSLCHTTSGWNGATFDHNLSAFPLTGMHVTVNCASCHTSGYTGTSTECYSCHQADYNGTTDPNHITEGFPTDCSLCHTTSGWNGATFDHNLSAFPLLGKHLQVDCASCHTTIYNGTPTECLSCHQQNYNQTTDPPHQSLNFSGECLVCHTMNGWTPANFNHNFFALSSRHTSLNCNECHSLSAYQPQCISCHLDDFLKEHRTGDNQKCWECHTTFTWSK